MNFYQLLLKYYYETELFDKDNGCMLDENGVYMPINTTQFRQGTSFAIKKRKELGLTPQMLKTREAWKLCTMSFKQLEQEYNEFLKLTEGIGK